jgi:hypothetical protein
MIGQMMDRRSNHRLAMIPKLTRRKRPLNSSLPSIATKSITSVSWRFYSRADSSIGSPNMPSNGCESAGSSPRNLRTSSESAESASTSTRDIDTGSVNQRRSVSSSCGFPNLNSPRLWVTIHRHPRVPRQTPDVPRTRAQTTVHRANGTEELYQRNSSAGRLHSRFQIPALSAWI